MAVILRSDVPYLGALADLPPINAPMPADAALYANPMTGQYITPVVRSLDPATVFDFTYMRERYAANQAGGRTLVAAGAAADRIQYDQDGQRLGMLVEGSSTQLIATAQRQDLTLGAVSGVAVTAGASTVPAWDRWFTLTPAGDAAHDLALASAAAIAANYRRTFAIELKTSGHRYVQLSSGSPGEATDFANFDLLNKVVTLVGGGATYAGVIPTAEGCICYIQYTSAVSGIEAPTISIIATAGAGKQEAALAAAIGPVQARLPKLRSSNVQTRLPPLSAMPGTADSVLADRLNLQAGLRTADFSFVIRARNSRWLNSWNPALFAFAAAQGTGTGASLRVTTAGNLAVVTRTSGTTAVAHDFAATLAPGAITSFGISKQGTTLRIVIGGETYEGDLPQIAGTQPFILSSPIETEGFDGHLQKLVCWSAGMTLAQLQARVAEEG